MGMFDSVMIPCPKCGNKVEAQTKSGDCILAVYDFPGSGENPAPDCVMEDVNRHSPCICECGCKFHVNITPAVVQIVSEAKYEIIQDE